MTLIANGTALRAQTNIRSDRQTDAPQGCKWLRSLKFLLAINLLAYFFGSDDKDFRHYRQIFCPDVSVFFVGLTHSGTRNVANIPAVANKTKK